MARRGGRKQTNQFLPFFQGIGGCIFLTTLTPVPRSDKSGNGGESGNRLED